MENGGTGMHLDSPSEWTDLTGNHTFNCNNGSAFSEIAWVGNSNRYITAKSELARLALTNKAFTLEMVVSHPASPVGNFEYWTYFGANTNNHRYLTMEIRRNNSSNPVVGGLQYRSSSYKDDVAIPVSTGMTAWNTRQYLAVVCDGNTATLYCDGTNVLHRITNHEQRPRAVAPRHYFRRVPGRDGPAQLGGGNQRHPHDEARTDERRDPAQQLHRSRALHGRERDGWGTWLSDIGRCVAGAHARGRPGRAVLDGRRHHVAE